MTCDRAEELLFESFDDELGIEARRTLDRHLASCGTCTALAAQLRVVDARLTAALPPISAPMSIAEGVRRRQRQERVTAVRESLPDIIHLAGCSVATLLSAALLPVDASLTLAVGVTVTGLTYTVMAAVRSSLEAAEQPDW
jgi:anti-sigma factor RsiW